jgi:hypothetical protein
MKQAQTIFAPSDDGTKSPKPVVVRVITEKYTQSSGRQPSYTRLKKQTINNDRDKKYQHWEASNQLLTSSPKINNDATRYNPK